MNGIINLYKPKGISSSGAISKVRGILGVKSAGHMGTLDPAGEGVLLVGVGKAARLFDYFLKKDKIYSADFTFGYETDTLDGEGQIVKDGGIIPDLATIAEKIKMLEGKQQQMPPDYSAKSIGGVRAYTLARQGKSVDLKTALVEIFEAKVVEYAPPLLRVTVHCSSGTYIRSVCRDLAALCGTVATMTAIKRIVSGAFRVEDSIDFDKLRLLKGDALIKIEDALSGMPSIKLPEEFKTRLNNGVKISVSELDNLDIKMPKDDFALFCGELYGIAHVVEGRVVIKSYLRD